MTVDFPVIISRGCGLDVHQSSIVAAIKGIDILDDVKTFGTFTEDIHALAGWLQGHGITHVAMESSGVYWKPVYNILEEFFVIILVNARHIKNVPGHKTDRKDSLWIAKLLISGLLKGSFIPKEDIRHLRDLNRHRRKIIGMRTSEKNRLQNVLEDANIKLSSVVSDVFGKTGSDIITAIVKGQTNPDSLCELAKGSLRTKKDQLRKALNGRITEHHIFMIKMILDSINHINKQIAQLEAQMEQIVSVYQQDVELLQTIPGVSKQIATGILSEIGNDMEAFGSHQRLSSWAGVCPGNNESAGKKYSTRTNKGNKYLKTTLVEGAWAASRSKANPIYAIKHKQIASKRGHKKATLAVAHKMLIAVFHVLRDKVPWTINPTDPKIIALHRMKRIDRLERQLILLKQSS